MSYYTNVCSRTAPILSLKNFIVPNVLSDTRTISTSLRRLSLLYLLLKLISGGEVYLVAMLICTALRERKLSHSWASSPISMRFQKSLQALSLPNRSMLTMLRCSWTTTSCKSIWNLLGSYSRRGKLRSSRFLMSLSRLMRMPSRSLSIWRLWPSPSSSLPTMQSYFTTPRNSSPRIWPRRTGRCTIVSSLELLIPLVLPTLKIIINMSLSWNSFRLSQLSCLSRPLKIIIMALRLNSPSQCSFLSKSNLLAVCRSKWLTRSSLQTVLRRSESRIKL